MASAPLQGLLQLLSTVGTATAVRRLNPNTLSQDVEQGQITLDPQQQQQQHQQSNNTWMQCVHFYCNIIILIFVSIMVYLLIIHDQWNSFIASNPKFFEDLTHLLFNKTKQF